MCPTQVGGSTSHTHTHTGTHTHTHTHRTCTHQSILDREAQRVLGVGSEHPKLSHRGAVRHQHLHHLQLLGPLQWEGEGSGGL